MYGGFRFSLTDKQKLQSFEKTHLSIKINLLLKIFITEKTNINNVALGDSGNDHKIFYIQCHLYFQLT